VRAQDHLTHGEAAIQRKKSGRHLNGTRSRLRADLKGYDPLGKREKPSSRKMRHKLAVARHDQRARPFREKGGHAVQAEGSPERSQGKRKTGGAARDVGEKTGFIIEKSSSKRERGKPTTRATD